MSLAVSGRTFGTTDTDITAFFKLRYKQGKIESLVEYGTPLYSMLSKRDEMDGIKTIVPIHLDSPQGMSANLATALNGASSIVGKTWGITLADFYAGITLDAKTLMAARKDVGAFFRMKERHVNAQLQQLGQEFERALWNDGSGSVGVISGDPGTGTTIQLADIDDAINFHVGMTVRFYDDDGAGGPDALDEAAGGTRVVSAVNEETGVITVSADMDASVETGDHIVRDGNINALVKGVPAWIPAAAASSTPFFDVNRAEFPVKLDGHRQAWLGSIEETAKKLDSKMRRVSQRGKVLWLSYNNFNRLDFELGARGVRDEEDSDGQFGRKSLKMVTPGGVAEVKCSPFIKDDVGYLLDMSTWYIGTLGSLPHLVMDDGNAAMRIGATYGAGGATSQAEDGIEIRFRAFWQLICTNPYSNGRFPIE